MNEQLPIEETLPALRQALRAARNAAVTAPPGAGKTTKVPLALLEEAWLDGRKIVMLEPRRIAARSAARRMAQLLGEDVGQTVGYRTKGDSAIGRHTRIEVVTEGILTRWLQSDPGLEDVGIVIFDEFHERSVHADLGLALSLQCQSLFREDLRIVVMSATLEAESVADILEGASVLRSEGRMYPIETIYVARRSDERMERRAASAVLSALAAHPEGDALVFLPGAGEIRRTADELYALGIPEHIRIAPLYGALSAQEQDAAVQPSRAGERKVVLATSIAETSLTVEGVRIVIDSGYSRVPYFSPRNGLSRLETVRVTAASADQRRGRAGRVAPGVCYRLWTEEEHRQLKPFHDPDILTSDLSPLALELAVWGVSDPRELRWIDPPPEGAYQQARELLRQLGALDETGAVTLHGRQIAELGAHPRLAGMIVRAKPLGFGPFACELAALLEERVGAGSGGSSAVDMRSRVEALRSRRGADAETTRRDIARRMREAGIAASGATEVDPARCGELLAAAYPDRIAMRRPNGTYLLANGRGAELPEHAEPLSRERFLAVAELDGAGANSRIRAAAPLTLEQIERVFPDRISVIDNVYWDTAAKTVRARRKRMLGAFVLDEIPLPKPDSEEVRAALMQGIRESGLQALSWSKSNAQWRQRMLFLRAHLGEDWPDVSDEALLDTLDIWLGPHLYGMSSITDAARVNVKDALEASSLTWEQRGRLEEWAPTHIQVPSGSRIAIDYSDPLQPVLPVRLQEVFGWQETPRIAGGRVPLTLHLLSPAQRPVQVTKDLDSFWQDAYFEVKKDLKGRYPKHHWPDDPREAAATRGTKPRKD